MKLSTLLAPILILSACQSSLPPRVERVEVPTAIEVVHPELPPSISLNSPEWVIIEVDEVNYAAVKVSDVEQILENYTNMGEYIKDLRSVIKYYRKVTTDAQSDSGN